MSVFGLMVRWGSMGMGVVLLVGGVQTLLAFRPRDERARAVTVAQAMALAATPGEHYVTVAGGLDEEGRVWDSLVSVPRFVGVDTNRTYPIRAGKESVGEELVGATVSIEQALTTGRIECQTVRRGSGGEELQGLQVLAPVEGMGAMVWVLSPWCRTMEEARAWQDRGTYRGAVSRFDDMLNNAAGLGYEASEIREYARDEMGFEIPVGAMLVIETLARSEGGGVQNSYATVEGTEGNLIVRVGEQTGGEQTGGEPGGAITGLLRTSRLRGWEGELPGLLGSSDPAKAMLLDTTTSAAAENAKDQTAMRFGLVGGPGLFAFGFVTTWMKHARRKRRGASGGFGGISPQQAQALGIPIPGPTSSHTKAFQQYPGRGVASGVSGARSGPMPEGGAVWGGDASAMAGGASVSAEDAALEAEMARWTQGSTPSAGAAEGRDRRAA